MKRNVAVFLMVLFSQTAIALQKDSVMRFTMYDDVEVSIDMPGDFSYSKETQVVLYALPNGNTTAQTMGKKMQPGDDWHYDIQHIKAQTQFVRDRMKNKNIVVAYLENIYKSWPAWKSKHENHSILVSHIVDTIFHLFPAERTTVCLSGHSGGGGFVFIYLDGEKYIPSFIRRIVFLDSDYGYQAHYGVQMVRWLKSSKHNSLQVFAYKDSMVMLNGKRIVSDTGGTWYRSRKMLNDLSASFEFKKDSNATLQVYRAEKGRIGFYLHPNPENKILHTQQVELNGFIHSLLAGTKYESDDYEYFGKRAYEP